MSLESIRSSCAEIESIDAMLVQELDVDARVQEDLVLRDHRVSALLDRSSTVARATLRAYRDADALLQSELAAMSNESTMFPSFYEKLRAQKLYHAQHRHVGGGAGAAVEARYVLPKDSALVSFSGEERWGRFVDLHAQYELFVNLDKVHASSTAAAAPGEAAAAAAAPRVDYHTYLETFARFDCQRLCSCPPRTTHALTAPSLPLHPLPQHTGLGSHLWRLRLPRAALHSSQPPRGASFQPRAAGGTSQLPELERNGRLDFDLLRAVRVRGAALVANCRGARQPSKAEQSAPDADGAPCRGIEGGRRVDTSARRGEGLCPHSAGRDAGADAAAARSSGSPRGGRAPPRSDPSDAAARRGPPRRAL